MKRAAALVVLVALALGCVGKHFSWDQVRRVQVGMTEAETIEIMGPPSSRGTGRESGRDFLTWSYSNGITVSRSVTIGFEEGRVVEVPPEVRPGETWVGQSPGRKPKTEAERAALAAIADEPLTFTLPEAELADAWGRAQSFVARFGSTKIQTVSDFVLETFNPSGRLKFGYSVVKTPAQGGARFDVRVSTSAATWDTQAKQNARILAHYVRTGVLVCESCIDK